MNVLSAFFTFAFGFLVTYLIHSTVIIAVISLIVWGNKWFQRPVIRVLAFKAALLLPLLTTTVVLLLPFPHVGYRIPLGAEEKAEIVLNQRPPDRTGFEPIGTSLPLEVRLAPDKLGDTAKSSFGAEADPLRAPETTVPFVTEQTAVRWAICVWGTLCIAGLFRLLIQFKRLENLRANAVRIADPARLEALHRLKRAMRITRKVELLSSTEIHGAFTAGILRPYILVASDRDGDVVGGMVSPEWEALLAHELAHIANRDASWNLLGQIVQRVFTLQPLNRLVCRQLRVAMDFAADESAAKLLGEQQGLIRCLIQMGDRLSDRQTPGWTRSGLATGMVTFRSTLARRVERLLESGTHGMHVGRATKLATLTSLVLLALTIATLAPPNDRQDPNQSSQGTSPLDAGEQDEITALRIGRCHRSDVSGCFRRTPDCGSFGPAGGGTQGHTG
ncbi:M56 family metallopeptidase [Roseiconus nitratireducens]|uniref:M56 family metallopeptidase n=1 Tax=Roseiconus nitratireducens TaxID=2605748 RepID=A0A5M6CXK1_9BACT|nr:M56 family metallopeptidase [Roseiconus nitratireducens]KAA5537969.1 M56 family metallopeptidase [Roseiconus nitratireducens]